MFKVTTKQTFTHDVAILVPVDGGHEEQTLKTTFNYLDLKQVETFALRTYAGTTDFLKAIIAAFHDLTDEKDAPLIYTVDLRDQLIERGYIRQGLLAHYFAAASKAKEGN